MVVEVRPEDLGDGQDALSMMRYQEELERMCWQQGNMKQTAPAQRMSDFVNGRLSYDLPKTSYAPGVISSPLHFWLPKPISKRLQELRPEGGKIIQALPEEFSFTTEDGHSVSNIRFERTEKGNIHFLATIDGREVKHVFTPKKEEWQAIMDAGFNSMSNEQKMILAQEYFLGKVR